MGLKSLRREAEVKCDMPAPTGDVEGSMYL